MTTPLIKDGLLLGIKQVASPNSNQRPDPEDISLLVIHSISLPAGDFSANHVESFFLNKLDISADPTFESIKDLTVSAHLFIRRNGQVVQFVPFHHRAWHAGVSSFEGRSDCNDFSIGIEMEGLPTIEYTEAQYQALAEVTLAIQQSYPKITSDRILGHEHIAPGRKKDPGMTFDWSNYAILIRQNLNSACTSSKPLATD
jgi:N-acetyl-anhydromuramoyl-L-alanine amidase